MSGLIGVLPGLISLEWEKCPDGYTVGTLHPEHIRYEVETCDDGDDHWRFLAYPADDAPDWLRETLIDDPHKNPWANSAVFWGEEGARRAKASRESMDGDEFIVPHSTRIISHTVIEDAPAAFMEFADCDESPDNTARFVSLYGYPEELEINEDVIPGTRIVTFYSFQETVSAMCEAIDMWERAKKTGDYRKLEILFEHATFLDAEDFDYNDIEINEPLAQLAVGLRLPSAGNTPPKLSFLPPDLETALWLQLAIAVTDAPEIRRCEECPTWFEVTPGKGRPEKKFCSNACSMRAYRKRKMVKSKSMKRTASQRSP